MKLISSRLCRARFKAQIKTRRVAQRNKSTIFFLCVIAIVAFLLAK